MFTQKGRGKRKNPGGVGSGISQGQAVLDCFVCVPCSRMKVRKRHTEHESYYSINFCFVNSGDDFFPFLFRKGRFQAVARRPCIV